MRPTGYNTASQHSSGFTLIELLITLVIVAILAAVALPSYQSYIERSRVRVAQADLVALATAVENVFQRRLNYPSGATSSTEDTEEVVTGWHPAEKDFTYTYTPESDGYTLTATHTSSDCTLTLGHTNERGISGDCGGISSW